MRSRMTKWLRCPKCKALSGDNWSQCEGGCPVAISPYFDEAEYEKYGGLEEVEDE